MSKPKRKRKALTTQDDIIASWSEEDPKIPKRFMRWMQRQIATAIVVGSERYWFENVGIRPKRGRA